MQCSQCGMTLDQGSLVNVGLSPELTPCIWAMVEFGWSFCCARNARLIVLDRADHVNGSAGQFLCCGTIQQDGFSVSILKVR